MAVRNFWIDADVDGRETMLSGGPRAKTGGMTIRVKQRKNGFVSNSVSVNCFEHDGVLTTIVHDKDGNEVYRYSTDR